MNKPFFELNIKVKRSFWEKMGGWIILTIAFTLGSLVSVLLSNFWIDLCLCIVIFGFAYFFWCKWIKRYNYFIFDHEDMIKFRNNLNEALKEVEDEAKTEEKIDME